MTTRAKSGQPWIEREDRQLKELCDYSTPIDQIAITLLRSITAIKFRIDKFGLGK